MIVVNFKKYKVGKEALELARLVEEYLGRNAIVCVAGENIKKISDKTGLQVFTQNVGEIRGDGSLLNHSDYRISENKIQRIVKGAGKFKIILCVENVSEARRYSELKPWAMAFEDKKLIGTGKSITKYRSEEVRKFVGVLKGTGVKALCGAGIHSAEDVFMAKKLGCEGVLISSAIAKGSLKKGEKLLKELGENEIFI